MSDEEFPSILNVPLIYGPIASGAPCVCPTCGEAVEYGVTDGAKTWLTVEDGLAVFSDEDARSKDLLHEQDLPVLFCRFGHRFTHADIDYVE